MRFSLDSLKRDSAKEILFPIHSVKSNKPFFQAYLKIEEGVHNFKAITKQCINISLTRITKLNKMHETCFESRVFA